MKVTVRQVDGITFIGRGETNHWVAIDGPKEFFGSEAASRPMELFLISLGSCTASDVASILNKKKIRVEKFIVEVEGDRVDEHPKVFTRIHIKFIFYGNNIDENAVKRSIELSWNKYCPITAMLKKILPMSYSYEILSSD
ncbi:MAG: osmotically inducible protein OsmC [Thermoplasmata archaeon]|nr:MAG: osmotically inducible protein OsmC [Thermoplasmata archaeon]HEC89685.1 OsmC family peroxiredoxin [Thermoplasmatales archaeon]